MSSGGRVEVRPRAAATGRVFDGSGAPYLFSLWGTDGGVNLTPPLTAWDHVAAGSYVLVVRTSSGDRSYPFSVAEGKTTTLEVE
jgi:hypothetical protein